MLVLLQACAGTGTAPVTNRDEVKELRPTVTQHGIVTKSSAKPKPALQNKSGVHIVNRGDTLYSIAWRYNFDYKSLAHWNNINAPYTIYPGQIIRLKPVLKKQGIPLKSDSVAKKTLPAPTTKPITKPLQEKPKVIVQKKKTGPALPNGPIKWAWPTNGKLVMSNSPTSKKGIDIAGKSGQAIKAAAAGEVVYSGSGLLGYGKLIIIKHNETYLSAYAYNSKLLVKEGDRVTMGQQISEMGRDNAGRTVLHFEIRQNGKPVTPTRHLPQKRA
jgi:lipoprotein NlpD